MRPPFESGRWGGGHAPGEHLFAFGGWRPPFGPPFLPPFGPHGRGRGRGARRGDVRAAILALLSERPMHGYEMISELEARTGGLWRPSPGSVYPTLQLLEDEGLITSEQAEGRRQYTLTDAGRAEADNVGPDRPWEEMTKGFGPLGHGLRGAAMGIMQAMSQVVTVGTDEQKERALDVLNETRRKLYGILAEDGE